MRTLSNYIEESRESGQANISEAAMPSTTDFKKFEREVLKARTAADKVRVKEDEMQGWVLNFMDKIDGILDKLNSLEPDDSFAEVLDKKLLERMKNGIIAVCDDIVKYGEMEKKVYTGTPTEDEEDEFSNFQSDLINSTFTDVTQWMDLIIQDEYDEYTLDMI